MLPRKTSHADLEKEKSIFFEIGLLISIGLITFLMNLNFKPKQQTFYDRPVEYTADQEMVPITRQQEVLPPPVAAKPIKVYDVINIVENDKEIAEELEILDTETDQDQKVETVDLSSFKVEEEVEEAPVFIVVEEMPVFHPEVNKTFEASQKDLMKYIAESIRYPHIAAENGVQGLVFVSFVVSPEGKVTNVELVRGVSPALDKEAIRVVEDLPAFSPGRQRGKPVRVKFSVPIRFVLRQ